MLGKFIGKKSLLFVPVTWLNEVANMLTTIWSPKRTIVIKIEGMGEGSNISLDINPSAVVKQIADELSGEFLRKGDISLLGDGMEWSKKGLSINPEWFRQQVIQGEKY